MCFGKASEQLKRKMLRNDMSLRELMIEYILFAFSEEELLQRFQVSEEDLSSISDLDILEIYDKTLLVEV